MKRPEPKPGDYLIEILFDPKGGPGFLQVHAATPNQRVSEKLLVEALRMIVCGETEGPRIVRPN